jgi:hypothetical protein
MKGPERVETLESNINEFVRASRGLPTSSAGLINLIPSTIGAIDKKEVRATMIPSETNLLKCEASHFMNLSSRIRIRASLVDACHDEHHVLRLA